MRLAPMLALLLASHHAAAQAPPGYTPLPQLSDEFDGGTLDAAKWRASDEGWQGRPPGLFASSNVVVAGGALQLWARAARRNASWPAGYDNYTTSAVHSLARARLGYFEIRWRSGSSGISSSWWFHEGNGSAWTEIDVFETTGVDGGAAAGAAKAADLPSHVHIFELPNTTAAQLPGLCNCSEGAPGQAPCSKGALFSLPAGRSFADDWHVASLLWAAGGVEVRLDGALVSTLSSACLVEEIGMDFDRETMPGWMALPDPATLPDQPFLIDYVRSFSPP